MGSYDLLPETGVDTVVGEAKMRFLAPGHRDDILRIEDGLFASMDGEGGNQATQPSEAWNRGGRGTRVDFRSLSDRN